MRLRFEVKGSVPEPYVVLIERTGDNLKVQCDCQAGQKGQSCKHRLQILKGADPGLVGGDISELGRVPELVTGTDVEATIAAMELAEKDVDDAKKRLSAAKKAVAQAMRD